MLKLIKWSLVAVITVGAAGYMVLGDHFGSYFSTVSSSVRESVRGKIPVEFELKRAADLIRAIDPEIRECTREVAGAEVDLEQLVKTVAQLERDVAKDERKLRAGQKILGSDAESSWYEIGGREWSRNRVEYDLSRTLRRYKNNKVILSTKKSLIARQQKAVTASKYKLHSVRSQKRELEDTIAELKAHKRQLDAMKASSHRFDLDDTNLNKAKAVLAKVHKRLEVTQKMIESDMYFAEGIDVGEPKQDVLKEIGKALAEDSNKKGLTARNAAPLEVR